jgi:CDP-diacylglycerol--serine O-phosphatidyltransferase
VHKSFGSFLDAVLYSGASLNNVYLARHGRYRLDRYHLLRHAPLADAMVDYVQRVFLGSTAVARLNVPLVPSTPSLLPAIRTLRQQLAVAQYAVPHDNTPNNTPGADDVAVTPLAGFGRTDNTLNDTLLALLASARERVVLLTPYFNLPRPVRAAIGLLLRRGCTVEIMVGDKVANDFYIPPGEPFRTIGVLPYLYESNLRRFARVHQKHLASGQLVLHLWKHADNSFHLKGLFVDHDVAVLTGNNLNPRAWALDLENALVLRDPHGHLRAQHAAEWAALRRHATRLSDHRALDTVRDYPAPVRKLLRRLKGVRLDRLAIDCCNGACCGGPGARRRATRKARRRWTPGWAG